ncbi:hypothetical protein EVB81_178 [Rhizobium phage RHph_I46]|uniref:Uncharacterized protein n=1 Tax=Rhizobium phage RHph_I1_9 TaxID=2509729 RepID=A0A7S5UY76_9CAUD|nr:hypothetical protein PP936_gp177 [Rhizobium phage RHph_I1_9]QIG69747.1 hypothetical protein EVB81_178 [Rhizobium phage RHph_I46]QIG71028.1 hypothetical protein EVB92_178 [Rhizobium phage RHph_I9]QIG73614.1 hypothetical protein EVC04_177 [Rhizobium phage RHph_I1_9]QIG76367.1 hypothetical protein EVC25_178 [Rhizobium phage RHph_I34]
MKGEENFVAPEMLGKTLWIAYDHQTGKWCVEEKPFEVVRPGMEILRATVVATEVVE